MGIGTDYGFPNPPKTTTVKAPRYKGEINIRYLGGVFDVLSRGLLREINKDKILTIEGSHAHYTANLDKIHFSGDINDYNREFIDRVIRGHVGRPNFFHKQIYTSSLDLFNVIQEMPIKKFIANDSFSAGLTFYDSLSKTERHIKRGEIDLIVDDRLIDCKLRDEIKFSKSDLIQLVSYYSYLTRNGYSIKKLGIYFARHAYLWEFEISKVEYFDRFLRFIDQKNRIHAMKTALKRLQRRRNIMSIC